MAERTYRIHIAAELSGVSPELIRAWERRYGVPRPLRTPAGYRVYTEQDVALLRRLKQLVGEGMSIREAAAWASREVEHVQVPPPVLAEGGTSRTEEWREAVLAAAERYDQTRVSQVLDEVLAALPPLKAFDEVLAPVQRAVGDRWHAGTLTVAQEHLVSQVVRARLVNLLHVAPENLGQRHAVLGCFPDEEHEVGLLGAALRLRHAGIRVSLLGQRVPVKDLGHLVGQLRPHLVGLSAVVNPGAAAFEQTLSELMAVLPAQVPLWVGGPAALHHAEVCARWGARVFRPGDDWAVLLA
ncbi:MerR family transcriptional regulator [Stigmatella aurantiaca]|uniref:B12 binding domain/transcriptional regulator, MerR family n=1 Tax=Stigmatella aurantiaca (strain DW4/3-1) TaxID=378806 RepID=Q08ZQ9_STIAD|nr:MerR family transcriptional regulator [Stigmatella aurantiaca]ADO74827.1 B12 binding domain/transcriptional regulator, MerR family [Stigmatella aurantiaca DW4/3-1]EAU65977.1 For protein sequence [Stigmatella aurantiaca DW4/3-1]